MKYLTSICILLLFFAGLVYSQDYMNNQSVVTPSPFYQPSPNGTISRMDIQNGYDNYLLGIDFGETYIVTNPRNPLNSFCAFNINNLYYTLDGVTWIKNTPQFPGFSVLGDPVMCYDSLGTGYYVQLYQNGGVYGMAVVKTTNGGVSWSGAYQMAAVTAGLTDKEWIVADQSNGPNSNNLYAGWRQFGTESDMRFIRSTNGGVNWSAPIMLPGSQGAYVSVGPRNNVPGGYVYFANLLGGSIVVYRSSDAGVTFPVSATAISASAPGNICAGRNTVKNCIRTDMMPRMAVDNSYTSTRGNVYISYAANPPGTDIADVYLVRSTDYGSNWSVPVRVNDDATTTDQWMPTVSVDKNGRVRVAWYDSRIDPGANLMTKLYGAVSTNGGVSFMPNNAISDIAFNPNNMAVGQPGGHNYMGDYIGISQTGYAAWMDGRNNSLGSYTAYYPDFAMISGATTINLNNNDSTSVTVRIPSTKGTLFQNIRFTAVLDTAPVSGSINISFTNGKDSVQSVPDSVIVKLKAVGNLTPKLYRLFIKGTGTEGNLVHMRTVNILVNSSYLTIGTNRNGTVSYKVNGNTYNNQQQLVFTNGSNVTVQAISPLIQGANQYVFVNWSDNGDTTHTITINNNVNLLATYKVQYKLILNSAVGNTFGGNIFYDSASSVNFGVLSRVVNFNGQYYKYKGFTGSGTGSYTSPDTLGNDTSVTISLRAPVLETANWTTLIGIKNLSQELPTEYKLYQNFPNPFNPNTTIKFDIIKTGNVKIVIYNLLGQEVRTLVNEIVLPGKYSVDFKADNFASGLYFYKIQTDEFTDIKKMLLVK